MPQNALIKKELGIEFEESNYLQDLSFYLASKEIGANWMKLFIIAEAGINHNGEISLAKELIKVAKLLSGANAVKFQAAIPNLVCTSKSPLAKYQKTNNSETQLNLLSKYTYLWKLQN